LTEDLARTTLLVLETEIFEALLKEVFVSHFFTNPLASNEFRA
jgi:hypothetical protein